MKKILLLRTLPVFKADPLTISVVSNVVMTSPNKLLATLKVERTGIGFSPMRHAFNLYNHKEVSNMAFRMAFQLKVNVGNILMGIAHFAEQIEAAIKEQEPQETAKPAPAMHADEYEAAIALLSQHGLMDFTLSQLQATGIQGEDYNSLMLYLAMTSRLTQNPLSAAIVGKSGGGKSWLVDSVASCMPERDVQQPVSYTGDSFYRQSAADVANSVFIIDDFDTAHRSLKPLLDLQGRGRTAKTIMVKNEAGKSIVRTVSLSVPICLVTCTEKEDALPLSSPGTLPLFLDGGPEQEARIMDYQRQLSAGLIDNEKADAAMQSLRNMQQALLPIKVVNPYAHLVTLPPSVLSPRRVLPLLLSFIEAITFYYQYQRECKTMPGTGEKYIESTPQDMYWAYKLLIEVLLIKSEELGGCTGSFYGWLKDWTSKNTKQKFGAADIRKVNPIHPRRLQRYLAGLADYGKIKFAGGSKHTGYLYTINPGRDTTGLQAAIGRHMGETMEAIDAADRERTKEREQKQCDKPAAIPCVNESHVALKPAPVAHLSVVRQIVSENNAYAELIRAG